MKILITGATGFVGKSLQSTLSSKGYEIYPTSRRILSNYIQFDVQVLQNAKQTLYSINPDVVVNLAWNTSEINYLESETNYQALEWNNLLYKLVANSNVKKIISAGSSIEYLSAQPTNYALTKRKDSENFKNIFSKTNIEYTRARIFQVYGPKQLDHKFIPSLILSIKKNQEFFLKQPQQIRDWIHVDDVAAALEVLITNQTNSSLDIGTTIGTSNQEICELLGAYFGLKWKLLESERNFESNKLVAIHEQELANIYKSQNKIQDFLRNSLL